MQIRENSCVFRVFSVKKYRLKFLMFSENFIKKSRTRMHSREFIKNSLVKIHDFSNNYHEFAGIRAKKFTFSKAVCQPYCLFVIYLIICNFLRFCVINLSLCLYLFLYLFLYFVFRFFFAWKWWQLPPKRCNKSFLPKLFLFI